MAKIIIVGRGGSGKDYLKKIMVAKGMKPSITCTSRPPRDGEVNGVDYHFTSREFFKEYPDLFYEIVEFNGWYYGTLYNTFIECDVCIMTPEGISKITPEHRNKCFIIYLNPPRDVIQKRLESRNDTDDKVQRRMEADDKDFNCFEDYDMIITNPYF